MRMDSLASEFSKARAVPWKVGSMLPGMLISLVASRMCCTATPSEAPGARLNDTVTTGNCPWWLIVREGTERSLRDGSRAGKSGVRARQRHGGGQVLRCGADLYTQIRQRLCA